MAREGSQGSTGWRLCGARAKSRRPEQLRGIKELLWSPGRARLCCTFVKGSGSRPVDVQYLKSPRAWLPGLRPESVPFVLLSCQVHTAARAEFILFLTHSPFSSSVFSLWLPSSDPKPCLLELNPAYYSPSQLHDSKVTGQLSYRPPGTSLSANT